MSSTLTLMDGGMGNALRMRFPEKLTRDPLWSARLLTTDDGMREVQKLHEEYLAAGSSIVTTNNYACVPLYLNNAKEFSCTDLTARAVDLACAAVSQQGHGKVMLSLPPLRQSYSPEVPPLEEAREVYNRIARAVSHRVDFLVAETVSTAANTQAPCEVAQKEGKPLMVSYTVSDSEEGCLRSGETVESAVNFLRKKSLMCEGMLFNCSTPDATTPALARLLDISSNDLSITNTGCYANSLKPIPEGWNHHRDGPPDAATLAIPEYVKTCRMWYDMTRERAADRGVAMNFYVGGCCGILPQHIEALHASFVGDK